MPNRSQEASSVHQAQNQKQTHANEQLMVQYNNHVKHDAKQTVKMEKSENKEYRYKDGKGKNGETSSGNKGNKKEQEEEKKDIKQGNFNILI